MASRSDAAKAARQARDRARRTAEQKRAKALGYPSVAAAKRAGWQPQKALGPSKQVFKNAQKRAAAGLPEDPKERRAALAERKRVSQAWSDRHSRQQSSRFDTEKARKDPTGYGTQYYTMALNSEELEARAELYAPMMGITVAEFLRRYGGV